MDLFFVGFEDLDIESAELKFIAFFGNVSGFTGYKTRDRGVVVILDVEVDEAFDLVDLGRTYYVPIAVSTFDDLDDLVLFGVFVLDLPTISSRMSSTVTRPATPPYSSMTTAIWT